MTSCSRVVQSRNPNGKDSGQAVCATVNLNVTFRILVLVSWPETAAILGDGAPVSSRDPRQMTWSSTSPTYAGLRVLTGDGPTSMAGAKDLVSPGSPWRGHHHPGHCIESGRRARSRMELVEEIRKAHDRAGSASGRSRTSSVSIEERWTRHSLRRFHRRGSRRCIQRGPLIPGRRRSPGGSPRTRRRRRSGATPPGESSSASSRNSALRSASRPSDAMSRVS